MVVQRAIALLCILLLAGCAGGTPPPRVPIDQTAIADVKTIALVIPAVPAKAVVVSLGGATALPLLFGIIGAAADTNIQEKRGEKYLAALTARGFSIQQRMTDALVACLKEKGFKVVIVNIAREKPAYLASYDSLKTVQADAYLDLFVANFGYFAKSISAPYRPLFGLQFKLVSAVDGKTLRQDAFAFTALRPDGKEIMATPDKKYSFDTFDKLMAQLDLSIEGLQAGVDKAAEVIAYGLE